MAYFAIDQVLVRRIPNLRYLTEFFFVCVSVFFAVLGVYRMPAEVLWIVLGVKLFVSAGQSGSNLDWRKTRFALPVLCAFLMLGSTFTKDALSLIVTGLSRSGVTVLPAMEQSVIDLDFNEGSTFRVEVVGHTFGSSERQIVPFKRETHLKATVTSGVSLPGPALSPEDLVVYESAYNAPRTLRPSNFEYLWGFREAQRIYEKGVLPAGTVIFTPDFTNPFPALLGSPMLRNSFLWLHVGTTISPDDLDVLTPSYERADLVLIPAAPTSRYSQPAISRSLLTFNKQSNGKFCLIGVSVLWLHYLRCDLASEIVEKGLTRGALLRERISAVRTLTAAALLAE